MSQQNSPYSPATGPGYVGCYRVQDTGAAQVSRGALREMEAEPGDTLRVYDHRHGAVLTTRILECELITEYQVLANGQVTLNSTVVGEHVGASPGAFVRVYESEDGLVLVDGDDDPRAEGGGA